MKLISVSKKKVVVYESIYVAPLSFSSERLLKDIEGRSDAVRPEASDEAVNKPEHVQSIRSVSAHTLPTPNTTDHLHMRPPTILDESADTQSSSLGEGLVKPEHLGYSEDLASGILALKKKAETTISDPGIRKRVIDSITNLQDASARVVDKGQLKKGKKVKFKIDVANIVQGKKNEEQQNKTRVSKLKHHSRRRLKKSKRKLRPDLNLVMRYLWRRNCSMVINLEATRKITLSGNLELSSKCLQGKKLLK
jgi:hypothetical protein